MLYLGNLLLLVLVGTKLLFATFVTELDIFVVLCLVVVDVMACYLDGAVGDVVDECTVVAHEYHGIATLCKELLQPLY